MYPLITDQCCEHHVRKMKDLLKSLHSQIVPSLVEKAVLAYNPQLIMMDHFFDSVGKSGLKSGGGHGHEYLSEEEKGIIRYEVLRLNMFNTDDSREKGIE